MIRGQALTEDGATLLELRTLVSPIQFKASGSNDTILQAQTRMAALTF